MYNNLPEYTRGKKGKGKRGKGKRSRGKGEGLKVKGKRGKVKGVTGLLPGLSEWVAASGPTTNNLPKFLGTPTT